MEIEINWKQVALDMFEESIRLRNEIKSLEIKADFWKNEALNKFDENLEINQGALECDFG